MFSQMKRVITTALVAVVFVTNATPAFAHDRDSPEIDPSCIGDETSTGIRLLPEDVFWLNDYLTLGEVNYGIRNGFTRGMFECYSEREAAEQSRVSRVKSPRPNVVVPGGAIEQMILGTFGAYGQKALRVALCESNLDPTVSNWDDPNGGSHGLFQINGVWGYTPGQLYDPAFNIGVAYKLSNGGSDWHWWSCKYA